MANFLSKKHLSRRTLLRGAGTTLALPFLSAMLPAATTLAQSGAAPKTRFGAIYVPHGATMARWTPKDSGKNFTLSEILTPLAPLREQLNVITNLSHPLAYGPGGAIGNHNRSSAAFLSGAKAEPGAQPRLGITLDQVIAQRLGRDTPLPSLELMIEAASLSCGEGLSCAYRNTISWQNDISPLPMQNNPQVVFENLFGDGATVAQRDARRTQSLSLLDSVTEQLGSLNKQLPADDKARLDRFVTDVREIERRIQQAADNVTADVAVPSKPTGIPENIEEHLRLMYDLVALAWQAEITRVSTFLMCNELSTAVYPGSGVRDSFHTLSHHSNNEDNKARFALINRYHVGLFKDFATKLASLPEGDGTLLDNALVLYGSGMSDGNSHNHDPLPILLVGGAGGTLEGNRHLVFPEKTNMSNLLLALLDKLGLPQASFGDSTEMLTI
ncbi:MAG: DUF1552 domain-containing protein [Pseudomonadales bacterium]|jgi:hypothetical protein|nr:DUF1552 domain-containing protein [Pseudomonadales bacterium]